MIGFLLPSVEVLLNNPLEVMVTLIRISSGCGICASTALKDRETFPAYARSQLIGAG